MADALDSSLLAQLRDVLDASPVTEAELRALIEKGNGWERALRAQLDGSERRLDNLVADPSSSLAELARELRPVEQLKPALTDAHDLHTLPEVRRSSLRGAGDDSS